MNKILPLIIVGVLTSLVTLTPATTVDSSTDSLNEKVTMATMKHSATVLLDENFSGSFPPDGWSTDWWKQCNCSGDPCACCYYYDQHSEGDDYDNYIMSKAVDASNYEKVILEFWFAADVQTYCCLYFKYRENETSPWKDITPWENPVILDFWDCFELEANFGPGGGGDAFQVNWSYKGYYSYFRYVYLDDVKIYSQTNNPPSAPYVTGPNNGKIGVEYNWTFVSTDPDEDNITYYIDWADECGGAEWYGPYPSGEEINIAHTYVYENSTCNDCLWSFSESQ